MEEVYEHREASREEECTRHQAPLSPLVGDIAAVVLLCFVWLNKSQYGTFSRRSGLLPQSFRFHQFRNCSTYRVGATLAFIAT